MQRQQVSGTQQQLVPWVIPHFFEPIGQIVHIPGQCFHLPTTLGCALLTHWLPAARPESQSDEATIHAPDNSYPCSPFWTPNPCASTYSNGQGVEQAWSGAGQLPSLSLSMSCDTSAQPICRAFCCASSTNACSYFFGMPGL